MSVVKTAVLGLLAITANLLALPARAQEGFPPATPEIVTWSARSCYAEATWSISDCSALLHVIRKRAAKSHWSFLKMLKRYSVDNWLRSSHGQQARTLKLAINKNQSERWNQNWQQLVSHVTAVLNDTVSDPCPNADHWAATYYTPKSRMRRVQCTEKVENAFWRSVSERRTVVSSL
jgi:hypothetical protein